MAKYNLLLILTICKPSQFKKNGRREVDLCNYNYSKVGSMRLFCTKRKIDGNLKERSYLNDV